MLIDFVKEAFGAEELDRFFNADGSIGHAEVRIGDSVVMMFDSKENWQETPCFLRIYVDDGDTVFAQALKAGATVVTELTELLFGDRVGRIKDPLGNIWWIQERLKELDEEEISSRLEDKTYIDAMKYVQDSLEL